MGIVKDTPIEDAINYLINEKGITVAGTSAGMAILGEAYYAPTGGSLSTEEALGNPFHPDTEAIGKLNRGRIGGVAWSGGIVATDEFRIEYCRVTGIQLF